MAEERMLEAWLGQQSGAEAWPGQRAQLREQLVRLMAEAWKFEPDPQALVAYARVLEAYVLGTAAVPAPRPRVAGRGCPMTGKQAAWAHATTELLAVLATSSGRAADDEGDERSGALLMQSAQAVRDALCEMRSERDAEAVEATR